MKVKRFNENKGFYNFKKEMKSVIMTDMQEIANLAKFHYNIDRHGIETYDMSILENTDYSGLGAYIFEVTGDLTQEDFEYLAIMIRDDKLAHDSVPPQVILDILCDDGYIPSGTYVIKYDVEIENLIYPDED